MMFMPGGQEAPSAGTLTIRVDGLKNQEGQIGFSVFNSAESWPDGWQDAFRSDLVPIESIPTEIELEGLPTGDYAVSVIHDENGSGDMDKNLFGIPKEGFGVSNNIKSGTFGPPKYEDAVFNLTEQDTLIVISIQY
jgi:uncharacterized protein (DUF2141 family)